MTISKNYGTAVEMYFLFTFRREEGNWFRKNPGKAPFNAHTLWEDAFCRFRRNSVGVIPVR